MSHVYLHGSSVTERQRLALMNGLINYAQGIKPLHDH